MVNCRTVNIRLRQITVLQVGKYEANKYDVEYPNIRFVLLLARYAEATIFSTLIPSFLFVGIAYLAFFLPTDSLPIRVTMLLFMLLNM